MQEKILKKININSIIKNEFKDELICMTNLHEGGKTSKLRLF